MRTSRHNGEALAASVDIEATEGGRGGGGGPADAMRKPWLLHWTLGLKKAGDRISEAAQRLTFRY